MHSEVCQFLFFAYLECICKTKVIQNVTQHALQMYLKKHECYFPLQTSITLITKTCHLHKCATLMCTSFNINSGITNIKGQGCMISMTRNLMHILWKNLVIITQAI